MPKEIEVCAGEGGYREGDSSGEWVASHGKDNNDGGSSELGCLPWALPDSGSYTRFLDGMASDKNQVQLV